MALESPAEGNPRFELPDVENGEDEDSKPMILGQKLSTDALDGNVPESEPATAKPGKETEKGRGAAIVKYFRNKSVNAQAGPAKEKPAKEKPAKEKPAKEKPAKEKPAAKEKTPLSSRFKKDWSKEQQALNKLKTSAAGTLSSVGRGAAEGGAFILEASKRTAHATAESLRKFKIFGTPLGTLCKTECAARPCPRVLLICCTAIVSTGLEIENIFNEEAPKELVEALADHLYLGNGAVLPPQGASPQVLACVIKHFLSNLPEPLLTYRLAPEWISAGTEPLRGKMLMSQLPSVNMNALDVLLDTCHRISGNSAVNEMDARSLAEALVPCLIWKQQAVKSPSSKGTPIVHRFFGGGTQTNTMLSGSDDEVIQLNDPDGIDSTSTPVASEHSTTSSTNKITKISLDAGETEAVVQIITYMISEYRTL